MRNTMLTFILSIFSGAVGAQEGNMGLLRANPEKFDLVSSFKITRGEAGPFWAPGHPQGSSFNEVFKCPDGL